MFGVSVATTSKLFGPLRLLPVALGMPFFHPLSLMSSNKSAFGVNLGHMWHESDMISSWMEILLICFNPRPLITHEATRSGIESVQIEFDAGKCD
jgi:hypothetical protein